MRKLPVLMMMLGVAVTSGWTRLDAYEREAVPPTRVNAENSNSREVIRLARSLRVQHRNFLEAVERWPGNAHDVIRLVQRYMQTYRGYWNSVKRYHCEESRAVRFVGTVHASRLPDLSGQEDVPPFAGSGVGRDPGQGRGRSTSAGAATDSSGQPVQDGWAAPLQGVSVTLTRSKGEKDDPGVVEEQAVLTDKRGRFRFLRLQDGAAYSYRLHKDGFQDITGRFTASKTPTRRRFRMERIARGPSIVGAVLALQGDLDPKISQLLEQEQRSTGDVTRELAAITGYEPPGAPESLEEILRELEVVPERAGRWVIRSQEEYYKVFPPARPDPRMGMPEEEPPRVDWKSEMVLAVSLGLRGAGYSVRISQVTSSPRGVKIHLVERRPAPTDPATEMATIPAHVVVVRRIDLPVRWIDSSGGISPVPLGGVEVVLYPQAAPGVIEGPPDSSDPGTRAPVSNKVHSTYTSEDGTFRFDDLEKVSYLIRVQLPGYFPHTEDVVPGDHRHTIILVPRNSIRPVPMETSEPGQAVEATVTGQNLEDPFANLESRE